MELAGVVLGAIPVVVGALQLYQAGMSLRDKIRNRREHVAELMRALDDCQVTLENYVRWALVGARIPHDRALEGASASLLASDAAVRKALSSFLGEKNSASFCKVLESCKDTLATIQSNLAEAGLPASPSKTTIEHSKIAQVNSNILDRMRQWRSARFALRKNETEILIRRLDSAIEHLHKLQNHHTAMIVLENRTGSARAQQIKYRLMEIKHRTADLHKIIEHSWEGPCHPLHCANLFLEDRLVDTQGPFFRLVLAGKDDPACAWSFGHETIVHFGDKVPNEQTTRSDPSGTRLSAPEANTTTSASNTEGEYSDLLSLCQAIEEAKSGCFQLDLSISNTQTFVARHGVSMDAERKRDASAVTFLSELLGEMPGKKLRARMLPLRACLLLVLTLSTATLQLGSTRWLHRPWSKEGICFRQVPTGKAIQVNLNQPMLHQEFSKASVKGDEQSCEAREVLLELGILMLEVWQCTPMEVHCIDKTYPLRDDYHSRRSAAASWLEESEDDLPPSYFEVVTRCIMTAFNDVGSRPTWSDESLIDGLVKDVVEPLRQLCRIEI